jgi:sugar lactone lactonase YvrE
MRTGAGTMNRTWSVIAVFVALALLSLTPSTVFAFTNDQPAFIVVGQPNFTSTSGSTPPASMGSPQYVAFSPSGDLWVADTGHARVLEFTPPFTDGEAATVVLGQPDFTSTACGGGQTGLCMPDGIAVDSSGDVWVADEQQQRILEFTPPFTNGETASLVLGEPSFTASACTLSQTGLCYPQGITFDSSGNLWVADSYSNRVVEFVKGPSGFTNDQAESVVLGQTDFTSKVSATTRSNMALPAALAFDSAGNLWVADWENNRVLKFDKGSSGFTNGQVASLVLGQSTFTDGTYVTTTQSGMHGPEDVVVSPSGFVWVADMFNNRILGFANPTTNGQAASVVIGQSSFTASTSGTTQTLMYQPFGVAVDASGNLWVADTGNNRVLEYAANSNCTPSFILCGILSFTLPNINCPPICTVPQGSYQETYLTLSNPAITGVTLTLWPPQPITPGAVNNPIMETESCTSALCGPFSADLSTSGTYSLVFSPNVPGASLQSLTFSLQVTPSMPTPEFPLGSLLALLLPLIALVLYVGRSKSQNPERLGKGG